MENVYTTFWQLYPGQYVQIVIRIGWVL